MRRADLGGLRAIWPLAVRFGVANAPPCVNLGPKSRSAEGCRIIPDRDVVLAQCLVRGRDQ